MGASHYDEDGVYNVWSRICHRPSCQAIQSANRRNLKTIRSWKIAVELGLKPCGICTPFYLAAAAPAAEQLTETTTGAKAQPSADEQVAVTEQTITELEQKITEQQQSPAEVHVPEIATWRTNIVHAISRLDQTNDRPPKEGIAARISRLSRAGAIPRLIASMMITITEMRNLVEYESKTLSDAERGVAWANWLAIQEWASKAGLQI